MQADGHLVHQDLRLTNVRRKGLRIALAVAVGFTWAVYTGAIIPFLAPFFAAQFLIANPRPLALRKAVGLVIVMLVTGEVLQFVTAIAGQRPVVLLLLLGLVYFACFFLQASGKVSGPTIFFVLVVAVMVPLLAILNNDLAASIMSIFIQGTVGGLLLMWIAHALIPDRGGTETEAALLAPNPDAVRFAACNAIILVISVASCLTLDGLSTATVIPITVSLLLSQADLARSSRAALGLVMVNLFGGVLACVAYAAYQVSPTGLFLFLIVLVIGLMLGGRAAQNDPAAKLYAGALTIFLTVLGSGVSPLPGSAAESFSTRIVFIFGAISYTIFMAALLWPRVKIEAPEPVSA